MEWGPFGGGGRLSWAQMRDISARVYGDPDATDPLSGYNAKAYPGFFHTRRSVIKDTLPGDDFIFPLIYSRNTGDGLARVLDMATYSAASVVGVDDRYGLSVGCRADLVILSTDCVADVLLDRPDRCFVIKGGRVVANTTRTSQLAEVLYA